LAADAFSFVQPVTLQDSATLESLFSQPNLLTSGVPYALDPSDPSYPPTYYQMPDGAYPLVLGPLVNKIPDADGTNQLINPINGSVITSDVFGNPRTSNGLRDVGAVQHSVPGPQQSVPGPLPLLGVGAAFGWSRRLRRRLGKHSQLHQ
jgi:MYXO-CTERM domain-containing protein